MSSKQRAEEASQTASSAKTEATRLSDLFREKEAECTALRLTAEQERKERKLLEEKVKKVKMFV